MFAGLKQTAADSAKRRRRRRRNTNRSNVQANNAAAEALEDLVSENDQERCWSVDSDFRLIAERLASLTFSEHRMQNSTSSDGGGGRTTSDLQQLRPVTVSQPPAVDSVTATASMREISSADLPSPGGSSSVSSPVAVAAILDDNFNSNARIHVDTARVAGPDTERRRRARSRHASERSSTSASTPSSITSAAAADHGKDDATLSGAGRAAGWNTPAWNCRQQSGSSQQDKPTTSRPDGRRRYDDHASTARSERSHGRTTAAQADGDVRQHARSDRSEDTTTSGCTRRWSSSAVSGCSCPVARDVSASDGASRAACRAVAKDRRRRRDAAQRSRRVLDSSSSSVSISGLRVPSETSSSALRKTSTRRDGVHGEDVTCAAVMRWVGWPWEMDAGGVTDAGGSSQWSTISCHTVVGAAQSERTSASGRPGQRVQRDGSDAAVRSLNDNAWSDQRTTTHRTENHRKHHREPPVEHRVARCSRHASQSSRRSSSDELVSSSRFESLEWTQLWSKTGSNVVEKQPSDCRAERQRRIRTTEMPAGQ